MLSPNSYTQKAEKVLLDYVDSSTIYVGEALKGALESSPQWKLMKIVLTAGNGSILLPTTSSGYTLVWDNRASYTYE